MSSSKSSTLTIRIFIGMGLGFLVGLLLNHFVSDPESSWNVIFTEGFLFGVGRIFVRLLKLLVVPLVFVSIVYGTASLDNIRTLGRVGIRTLALYMLTTVFAITLALLFAAYLQPGTGYTDSFTAFEPKSAGSFLDVIIGIFPSNPVQAFVEGNMLQIIIFSILFGIALALSGKVGEPLLKIFGSLNEVILKLVWIVLAFAPYGVFALVARTFAQEGFDAIWGLARYFGVVLLVLVIHALVIYPILLKALGRLNPLIFLKKIRDVLIFAFSTASSNATIPVTLKTAKEKLGVKESIASFTIPLGATINMDGTAIMQGVATVFIAQMYGIQLELTQYLLVIATATLASIGTAGIPSAGLVMLTIVLQQVGLPIEAIGLILGVDRLLDMVRTAVNVTGDSAVACIVAKSENALDKKVFESPS